MFKRLFLIGVLCITVMAVLGTNANAYPSRILGAGQSPWSICVWSDWAGVANSEKDPTFVRVTVDPRLVQFHYWNPAGLPGGWGVPFYPEAQVEGTDVFNGDSATRNGRYHSVICFEAGDFDIPEEIIPDPPNPKWTRDPDSLVLLENDTWIRGYSDLDGDGFTETETAHLKLNCTLNYDRTEYICVIEESWGWKRNKDEICPYENEPQFTSAPVTTATEDVGYIYDITTSDLDVGDTLEITGTILPIPTWLFLDDNGDGTATLYGTPTSADVGDHDVDLQVTDFGGLSDAQSFTITVEAAAP